MTNPICSVKHKLDSAIQQLRNVSWMFVKDPLPFLTLALILVTLAEEQTFSTGCQLDFCKMELGFLLKIIVLIAYSCKCLGMSTAVC